MSLSLNGQEDVEVRLKDNAARNWCESASALTHTAWKYLKVQQKEFETLNPTSFEELCLALDKPAAG